MFSDAASARAKAAETAAPAARRESEAVNSMRFRLRIRPPPIFAPVPKGSQAACQKKRKLAALGQIEELFEVEDYEDSEDDVPITQLLGRLGRGPRGGEGTDDGGAGSAAAV